MITKILLSAAIILSVIACRKPLPPEKEQKKTYYVYYRVKTVDKDGKTSYSTVRVVQIIK